MKITEQAVKAAIEVVSAKIHYTTEEAVYACLNAAAPYMSGVSAPSNRSQRRQEAGMSKLLPCPFCNETPHIDVQKGHGPQARFSYYREHVVCACGASTKLFKAPGKAVAAWNTRHTPTPCDELVTVAWRHPASHWAHKEYTAIIGHCLKVGPQPEPLITRQNAEEVIAAKDERIKELEADNKRLREALEFYADTSKYPAPLTGGMGELWADCGGKARAALGEVKL